MPNGVHNAGCVSLNLDKSSYDENICVSSSFWKILNDPFSLLVSRIFI